MTTNLQVGEVFSNFALPNHQGKKPIQPPFTSDTLHPFSISLLISLGCGVGAAGITRYLITKWQRRSDNKVKLPQSNSQAKLEGSNRTLMVNQVIDKDHI